MIVELTGQLKQIDDQSVVIEAQGVGYEVFVPASIVQRLQDHCIDGIVSLKIYHYLQMSPSAGVPILVGFLNDVERDFFQQFIKVSGIGPRAAVKALNKPISDIAQAIDHGDAGYLKTLPGIGMQRAKEVVAKLQGKVGKFGLIQDHGSKPSPTSLKQDFQAEALDVLLQLQYKKQQAADMITKALEHDSTIKTAEELLNQIYKQKAT